MALRESFWERYSLAQLTSDEWEALCDGCGKCCLHKLEDTDSGRVHTTRVACKLLDLQQCRCGDYAQRLKRVSDCVNLRPDNVKRLAWLPASCAYRRVAQGQPLPSWHYLRSGDRDTVHWFGASIKGRAIAADYVHPDGMEEHIIHWVDDNDDV
jgi:uncharacterized cysteine cluster protein YcgN (CxxCxxCC family)